MIGRRSEGSVPQRLSRQAVFITLVSRVLTQRARAVPLRAHGSDEPPTTAQANLSPICPSSALWPRMRRLGIGREGSPWLWQIPDPADSCHDGVTLPPLSSAITTELATATKPLLSTNRHLPPSPPKGFAVYCACARPSPRLIQRV